MKLPIFVCLKRGWLLELSIFSIGDGSKPVDPRKWRVFAMLHSDQIRNPFATMILSRVYIHTQFRVFFWEGICVLSFQILGSIFNFVGNLIFKSHTVFVCREHPWVVGPMSTYTTGFSLKKYLPKSVSQSREFTVTPGSWKPNKNANSSPMPLKDMIVYARTVGRHSRLEVKLWSDFCTVNSVGLRSGERLNFVVILWAENVNQQEVSIFRMRMKGMDGW